MPTNSPETLQGTVKEMVRDAVEHYNNYLQRDQVEATDLYFGHRINTSHGDLTKIEGRSGAISTDVRDAAYNIMPSLMRVLMGSDRVVEFIPTSYEDTPLAALQTDVVNYVIRKDNDGFRAIYSAILDGLIRRVGWVKWWWDDGMGERRGLEYTGLSEIQAGELQADEVVISMEVLNERQDEQTGETLYDVSVIRRGMPRVRIQEVPPEEVVYSRGSTSIEDASCVAHVREMPADEVVGMGYDKELIDGYKGTTNEYNQDTSDGASLRRTRHSIDGTAYDSGVRDVVDDSQRPVLFSEVYAKVDVDEDGIAELRMFHCIGDDYMILNGDGQGELVDEVPLAKFTPFIEPHTMVGLSVADLVGDIQVKKSLVERAMEHSLARAIDPRLIVNEHAVNAADLIDPGLHQVIRTRGDVNASVRELQLQYLGDAAIQVNEYFNEKRADRIGMTRASEGLDPSALQSSTAEAVSGTFSRSAEIKEMVARVFAETGMKDLFKGVLRTIQRNQDFVRNLRMDDGTFIEMAPQTWNLERDVEINVGEANSERKVAGLMNILGSQKELMAGGAPFVTWVEMGNAVRRLAKALDYRNPTEFFAPWGPEQQAQYEMQMQMEQKPDTDQQLVDVERAKVMLQDLRERDKIATEAALKEKELEAKYAVTIDNTELKGKFDLAKQRMADETDLDTARIAASSRSQGGSDG